LIRPFRSICPLWEIGSFFGVVSLVLGAIGGWISSHFAYVNQRKLDDSAWEREKEKIQQQYQHEFELARNQMKQELTQKKEQLIRFEILPKVWEKITQAYLPVIKLVSYRPIPDLTNLSEADLNNFLQQSDLDDAQQKGLRESSNKDNYYVKQQALRDLKEAREVCHEFMFLFVSNKTFISDELYFLLDQMHKCFMNVVIAFTQAQISGDESNFPTVRQTFLAEARNLMPAISRLIKESQVS
jgi:hypothetical protein